MKYDHPTAKKILSTFPQTCIHLVYGNLNLEKTRDVSEAIICPPPSDIHHRVHKPLLWAVYIMGSTWVYIYMEMKEPFGLKINKDHLPVPYKMHQAIKYDMYNVKSF